ncbi:MAG: flagellar biosynthesis protein FlhF [Spirochaetales bacterium]|jgi:flagellar biosynthesis protein FlhF|nr:flagellar biosynthesis protein FlhF [Spirochaetales bacterium]
MQYFSEQGLSYLDVKQKIKDKYGPEYTIISYRTIRTGGFLGLFAREGVEVSGYVSDEKSHQKQMRLEEEKNRIIAAAALAARPSETPAPRPTQGVPPGGQAGEPPPPTEPGIHRVLKELKEIRETVSRQESRPKEEGHPHLVKIEDLLAQNDFSLPLIRELTARLKDELPLSALEDFAAVQEQTVKYLCDKIKIYPDKGEGPRRLVFLGPTGVGKTTTIAKLAGRIKKEEDQTGPKEVRLITTDYYRIMGVEQLESCANILEIPLAQAKSREELKEKADLFAAADWILVDTTGRSPRDYLNIAHMREILSPLGSRAEYFLLISASTKASDMRDILREYESFGYAAVILTKLDETQRIGNIISVLAETGKPLAYITFGQGVPWDMEPATKIRLIKNLENFTINIEKLRGENYLEKGKEWTKQTD